MPWPTIDNGLTLKQERFVQEYVRANGNATKAALAAGYAKGKEPNAAVQGSENLRKPKIRNRIRDLTLKHEISAERVLKRLDNLSTKAEAEGQIGAAVKAEELIGKSLGMWVDKTLNVNVDVTGAHLEALRDLLQGNSADTAEHVEGVVVAVSAPVPHASQEDDAGTDTL